MDTKNESQGRWPFVIILVLVFTGIIIYRLSHTLSPIEANTGQAEVNISNVPAPVEANIPIPLHLEQKQELPTSYVMETPPRVEAIFISGSGEAGIFIGENYVREGDIVDGFRILKIYPNKVEYEKDGKKITGVFPSPKTEKTKEN